MSRYVVDLEVSGDSGEVAEAYDAFVEDLKRRGCGFEGSIMLAREDRETGNRHE